MHRPPVLEQELPARPGGVEHGLLVLVAVKRRRLVVGREHVVSRRLAVPAQSEQAAKKIMHYSRYPECEHHCSV